MRRDLVLAGAALLIVGIVMFAFAWVGASQAAISFTNCLMSNPPTSTFPTACTEAVNAIAMYTTLEAVAGLLGLVGFVLLLVGLLLEPPRPAFFPMPGYPPPAAAPPPGYSPREGPPPPPTEPRTRSGYASNTN